MSRPEKGTQGADGGRGRRGQKSLWKSLRKLWWEAAARVSAWTGKRGHPVSCSQDGATGLKDQSDAAVKRAKWILRFLVLSLNAKRTAADGVWGSKTAG